MKVLIRKVHIMVRADHFASDDTKDTMDNLEEGYRKLKDLSSPLIINNFTLRSEWDFVCFTKIYIFFCFGFQRF